MITIFLTFDRHVSVRPPKRMYHRLITWYSGGTLFIYMYSLFKPRSNSYSRTPHIIVPDLATSTVVHVAVHLLWNPEGFWSVEADWHKDGQYFILYKKSPPVNKRICINWPWIKLSHSCMNYKKYQLTGIWKLNKNSIIDLHHVCIISAIPEVKYSSESLT